MPNINDAFPSKYIKASDLNGSQPVVTISHVEIEEVGRDKDKKLVAYFKGKEKGMVLNKTNAKRIADLLGSADTDDWTGKQIRIFPTETEFGGETVECIRVKAATAAKAKPAPPPPPATDDGVDYDSDEPPF